MTLSRLKAGYYLITAVATIASSSYFNYLFFFLHDRFEFGNRENLAVAAFHGAIYATAAWPCGRFAERRGNRTSLKVGFALLSVVLAAGALVRTPGLEFAVIAVYSVSLLFIWPALEALTTEHEPPARIPHMVGIYNCVWSGSIAVAYFTGGSLYDWLGVGSVFWMPSALFAALFAATVWLDRQAAGVALPAPAPAAGPPHLDGLHTTQPVSPRTFLRLAWVANPFSYVAIYTLLAVMPGLGHKLGLSPARVGLFCSVWFFSRLVAFVALWNWTGWHYRFGWLIASYLVLTASFVVILLAPSLSVIVSAQMFFGVSCGLIYYSSLFYSMDVGDAKAEHGGLHEGAIGVGIFGGPAVGALALYLAPGHPNANAAAVTALLVVGLTTLVTIRGRAQAARTAAVRSHHH